MSGHAYEVSLSTGVYHKELAKTLNRLSLHSESTTKIHTREVVFEPLDAQLMRESGQEPVLLRAKKELTEPNSPWYVSLDRMLDPASNLLLVGSSIHISSLNLSGPIQTLPSVHT